MLKSPPHCHRSVRNDMRLFPRTKQYPVQLRTTKFWKVLPQYYSVLQSTTPEGTTPVLQILIQYYSVLQSTSPVLLRTTKYYSSTTPYYKVLVQYYSVLQSITPVLQSTSPALLRTTKNYSVLRSTTKYYSSTTPYYKVLVQYYFVLQSTTPVLLRTTKYHKVLLQYYFVLQSTTVRLHSCPKDSCLLPESVMLSLVVTALRHLGDCCNECMSTASCNPMPLVQYTMH